MDCTTSVQLTPARLTMAPREHLYRAKAHFITYPQCSLALDKPTLFGLLADKLGGQASIEECFIARELHEDGTPHFHIYLKTKARKNVYPDTFDLPFAGANEEFMHGNYQAVKDIKKVCEYLSKEDTDVFCYGPFHIRDVIHARKSKTSKACAMALNAGKITREMLDEFPEMLLQLDKVKRGLDIVRDMDKAKEVTVSAPSIWYTWQENLINLLSREPDPRKIRWYVDPRGNTGKSFLARYLVANNEAIVFNGGKTADILYGYRGQPIVLFDFAREKQDQMNYGVIETLKNGVYYNSKYESEQRVYRIPHVVCFSNFEPNTEAFSEDRWDIKRICCFEEYDMTDYLD